MPKEGSKAFHVHAHLYEGETAVFALGLPQWENDKQREFVAEYVRAFFYNLLSTLGALRIEIYLDRSDEALTALAEGLSDDFQVSWAKTERTGYGKCLNVNERIIRALTGGSEKFSITVKDLADEPAVQEEKKESVSEPVFTQLPERAKTRFLLGIDVGGTDIKFAVSLDGKLLHCEELNWAPASISCVEDLTAPVLDAAERLMKQFGGGRKWDGIGLSWPDAIIHNMIVGVTEGYKKELEVNGVGYRVQKQGKKLVMNIGYSHQVIVEDTEDITIEVPNPNSIIIHGIDKQKVGQFAAEVREKRPPEPYKGKGIKYAGEYIRRKEGKAGKA